MYQLGDHHTGLVDWSIQFCIDEIQKSDPSKWLRKLSYCLYVDLITTI